MLSFARVAEAAITSRGSRWQYFRRMNVPTRCPEPHHHDCPRGDAAHPIGETLNMHLVMLLRTIEALLNLTRA